MFRTQISINERHVTDKSKETFKGGIKKTFIGLYKNVHARWKMTIQRKMSPKQHEP